MTTKRPGGDRSDAAAAAARAIHIALQSVAYCAGNTRRVENYASYPFAAAEAEERTLTDEERAWASVPVHYPEAEAVARELVFRLDAFRSALEGLERAAEYLIRMSAPAAREARRGIQPPREQLKSYWRLVSSAPLPEPLPHNMFEASRARFAAGKPGGMDDARLIEWLKKEAAKVMDCFGADPLSFVWGLTELHEHAGALDAAEPDGNPFAGRETVTRDQLRQQVCKDGCTLGASALANRLTRARNKHGFTDDAIPVDTARELYNSALAASKRDDVDPFAIGSGGAEE